MKKVLFFAVMIATSLAVSVEAQQTKPAKKKEAKVTTHTDPVCHMKVKSDSKWAAKYQQKDYYFCNPMCKEKFEEMPEKFIKK